MRITQDATRDKVLYLNEISGCLKYVLWERKPEGTGRWLWQKITDEERREKLLQVQLLSVSNRSCRRDRQRRSAEGEVDLGDRDRPDTTDVLSAVDPLGRPRGIREVCRDYRLPGLADEYLQHLCHTGQALLVEGAVVLEGER